MKHLTAYVFLMLLLLSGCGAQLSPDEAQESIQVIAMDTAMLITTYGEPPPTPAKTLSGTWRPSSPGPLRTARSPGSTTMPGRN